MAEMRGELEVGNYAAAILAKFNLPRNIAKGDWSSLPISAIWHLLEQERREVDAALTAYFSGEGSVDDVIGELADEGAFLTMLHDVLSKRICG